MPHAVAAHRGIRTDRWKLMYFPDLDSVELYDLQTDPNELHNLAGSPDHQAIVEGLTKRLEHGIGTQFTTTRAPSLAMACA